MSAKRFSIFVSLLFLVGLFSSFRLSTGSKKIGVYDKDSVLNSMPAYLRIEDSLSWVQGQIDMQLSAMKSELQMKEQEFRNDSIQWSPLIKALKKQELDDRRNNCNQFQDSAKVYMATNKKLLEAPAYENLRGCEKTVTVQKHLDEVIDKARMSDTEISASTFVNVTADMMKEAAKYK